MVVPITITAIPTRIAFVVVCWVFIGFCIMSSLNHFFTHNIIFYAATVFSGILTKGREYIKGKTGFWKGFTP